MNRDLQGLTRKLTQVFKQSQSKINGIINGLADIGCPATPAPTLTVSILDSSSLRVGAGLLASHAALLEVVENIK